MPKKLDLTNQVFGLVKCISPAESRKGKTYWNCQCIKCGAKKVIQTTHLRNGTTKTCGCGCLLDQKQQDNSNNQNFLVCEICGTKFYPKTVNAKRRKYCYNCSPEGDKSKQIISLRQAMKKEAVKRKGCKCEICGYSKNIAALQFHHINPKEKQFGLSQSGITHSWEEYWREAQKCILVCANCHAEIHSQENG